LRKTCRARVRISSVAFERGCQETTYFMLDLRSRTGGSDPPCGASAVSRKHQPSSSSMPARAGRSQPVIACDSTSATNLARMAVTITDEQAKNSATSLRVSAASQLATMDLVDPPVSPTPVPPGGGGSTPAPSGFTGRTLGDLAIWKQQASFEENFPTLAPRGQFLSIYKMWGGVPRALPKHRQEGLLRPRQQTEEAPPDLLFTVKRSTTGFVSKTRMSERGVGPSAANICFYERPKRR